MKKYNKGTTMVEILISISIISIVLVFLFALLVRIRRENDANNTESSFLVNQATLTKNIEEDIVNYGVEEISYCDLDDANINGTLIPVANRNNFICVKIVYAADYIEDKVGYIMIYNYSKSAKGDNSSWVIEYERGKYGECVSGKNNNSTWKSSTTVLRDFPEEVDISKVPQVVYTVKSTGENFGNLIVPIVTFNKVEYNLELAFKLNKDNFACDSRNPNKLNCDCKSGVTLCQNTYNYADKCYN